MAFRWRADSGPRLDSGCVYSRIIYQLKKSYNAFNIYRRELAPGTVYLTGYRATTVNIVLTVICSNGYNPFLVYFRELAPSTVTLTGDRAQGDDSKHDSHHNDKNESWTIQRMYNKTNRIEQSI